VSRNPAAPAALVDLHLGEQTTNEMCLESFGSSSTRRRTPRRGQLLAAPTVDIPHLGTLPARI
jgi:hypothetical protein